jgi:WD40 repeat protein
MSMSGGTSMRRFAFLVLSLFCLGVSPSPLASAQTPETPRPVQLAWFPRFSPDGKWLASAHGRWDQKDPGELRLWNATTGQERITHKQARGVRTVVWAPVSTKIVTGGYGGDINTYDTLTGKLLHAMKPGSQVENLLITPDEKYLITTHGTGSVILFDFQNRKQVYKWEQIHKQGIWGAALSMTGTRLATAGQDGIVRVFDLEQLKVLHEFPHPRSTNGVTFTHDERRLATGCSDGLIRVFDLANGNEVAILEGHTSGITELRFTKDNQSLFSAGMDQTVRKWTFSNDMTAELTATIEAHSAFVFGLDLSADETWLATAGWDNVVKVWKTDDLSLVWKQPQ